MLDVLVCFRPFVRLHLFDPLERSSPHLLLLLFLLAPTSLVQRLPVVRGSRQHHYLPFTPSLSPPRVNSLQIPVASQAAFMFSSRFPLFHVIWCTKRVHTAVKVAVCPQDCIGSCCQVSLNPPTTSPTAATRRIPC